MRNLLDCSESKRSIRIDEIMQAVQHLYNQATYRGNNPFPYFGADCRGQIVLMKNGIVKARKHDLPFFPYHHEEVDEHVLSVYEEERKMMRNTIRSRGAGRNGFVMIHTFF